MTKRLKCGTRIFTAIMAAAIMVAPLSAQAATINETKGVARASTTATGTATDSAGNKFKLTGIGTMSGKSITVTTSFSTSLYKDGTKSADSLKKTLTAKGSASFSNSATFTGATKTGTLTGGSGSISKTYSGLAYNAKTVTGQHGLSCNGGSTSGVSFRS